MSSDRRLAALLVAALAVAVPAIVLVAVCAGRACERAAPSTVRVPFCSLSPQVRDLVHAGFRDGRSPHVMAVTGARPVIGGSEIPGVPWPSANDPRGDTVPLVFATWSSQGTEARFLPDVPDGTRLDAVAPTIADIIDLDRPHPGVRSGQALPRSGQPDAPGERPRLVLLVVWKGIGSRQIDLARLPRLHSLFMAGTGTGLARVGSLPVDPAPVLATIGTGGLPSDHGITGSLVRNDRGEVVRAFGPGSPFSVIAALGDDLDELRGQEPRIGLVGTEVTDRGLIGHNWYLDHDKDDVVVTGKPARQVVAARDVLTSGYGDDAVPDLLAVAMRGPLLELDEALGSLLDAAGGATDGSVLAVVTATGSNGSSTARGVAAASVDRDIRRALGADVIEAIAVGGFFLDQEALERTGITDDRVMEALRDVERSGDAPLFADVFPQVAVTFAKYC